MSRPADLMRKSLRIYSRPGCHLCEQMVEELQPLVRGRMQIEVVDIDTRTDWQDMYGARIPVLECNKEIICQYTLDVAAVKRILAQQASS
jgi:glutaredoxin-like protein DUF836